MIFVTTIFPLDCPERRGATIFCDWTAPTIPLTRMLFVQGPRLTVTCAAVAVPGASFLLESDNPVRLQPIIVGNNKIANVIG
jgi:hypothetical protein